MKHYRIDFDGLHTFLSNLRAIDFEQDEKIERAYLQDEIERMKLNKKNIRLSQYIPYGHPFLVDALGNDLSIIIPTKKKYKLPNDRVIKGKYDMTIISDCRNTFGTPLNGYWVIPEQFITWFER